VAVAGVCAAGFVTLVVGICSVAVEFVLLVVVVASVCAAAGVVTLVVAVAGVATTLRFSGLC
jgi:hypothetical protein